PERLVVGFSRPEEDVGVCACLHVLDALGRKALLEIVRTLEQGRCLASGTVASASSTPTSTLAPDHAAARDRDHGDPHDDQPQARTDRADLDAVPGDLAARTVRKAQQDQSTEKNDADPDDDESRHGASLGPAA